MNIRLTRLRKNPYQYSFLILILILSAVLRLTGLSVQSFWFDELQTAINSNPTISWQEMLQLLNCCDSHPPLFFILERISFFCFGYTEFAARLVSALAGIASVWAIYLLGKEIKNERVGLIAAAITSVNFFNIYYSQEARGYTLLVLLTTFSHLYFIRICKYLKVEDAALYVLFTTLLLYTHYFSFLIVFSHLVIAVFLWLAEKEIRKKLFITMLVSDFVMLILYLPWAPYFLKMDNLRAIWITVPKPTFFIDYFREYFGNYNPVTAILVVLLFYYLLQVFIYRHEFRNLRKSPLTLSFLWSITTLVVFYLIPYLRSIFVVPMLVSRYTIVALPSIIIAIAFSLSLINIKIIRYVILSIFLFLSLNDLITLKKYYTTPCKTQFRELTQFITTGNKSTPLINEQSEWQQGYYLTRYDYTGVILKGKKEDVIDSILQNSSSRYDVDTFWLVGLHTDPHLNSAKSIALNRTYQLVIDSNFFNAWAQLYVRRNHL